MTMDLADEVEAINSIYGDGSLVKSDGNNVYVLHLPDQAISLRLEFLEQYPDIPPVVLGVQSSGLQSRKGDAVQVLELFRTTVASIFSPGEVCLFNVVEEVRNALDTGDAETDETAQSQDTDGIDGSYEAPGSAEIQLTGADPIETPSWTISDVVTELKSVFVARCENVSSVEQAKGYLQHLLDTDRKVARATHNITAWRIKGKNGATFQDCDDDGEAAAGGRVLHLMQVMDVWDVMVVVTRWYGGQKLGPARFGIINGVARNAFVKAGIVSKPETVKQKGKHS